MKWLIIGGVALVIVGGVCWLLSGNAPSRFNRAFGMALSSDQMIRADPSAAYGMAFYGGFHDMQQSPSGVWSPSMLEGR